MKSKKNIIIVAITLILFIFGVCLMAFQKSEVYSYDNMMPGEYGLGYLFGNGIDRTGVTISDAYSVGNNFEYAGKVFKNAIVVELGIDYDNGTDYNYYVFSNNEDIEYWIYNDDNSKVTNLKGTYIRDKQNDKVIVVLESKESIDNAKWVRMFGLNSENNMYDKTSLYFTLK